MTIKYSNQSLTDVLEICDYIKTVLKNEPVAQEIKEGIFKETEKLEDSPFIGTPVILESIPGLQFYSLRYKNYLVFYRICSDVVLIERVLYARRDFERMLKN